MIHTYGLDGLAARLVRHKADKCVTPRDASHYKVKWSLDSTNRILDENILYTQILTCYE